MIGILRWIVELGRMDICYEVSMLASQMVLPRMGHMTQVLHIVPYLRPHHNAEMLLDPSEPEFDMNVTFSREDWSDTVCGDIKEELPHNNPETRGFGFKIVIYIDSYHAGDNITRPSRTGFVVFLNSSPIYWTSKKQISTSTFDSEIIALKTAYEYTRGLRYKLRMMGIPCDFPTLIFGDYKSVLTNSLVPDSVLIKKSAHIAYSFVC